MLFLCFFTDPLDLSSEMYCFSKSLQSIPANARTCSKCKHVFPLDSTIGRLRNHERHCNPRYASVDVSSRVPTVASNLVDAYHDDGGGFDCFEDVGGRKLARDLFDGASPGEQEAKFEDVLMGIFDADDDEVPFRAPHATLPTTSFSEFQLRLCQRSALGFRSTPKGVPMDKLVDVFSFVRKYNLGSQAGS